MGELRTLQNGMRLYLDPMPELESAALGVWVRAGTLDETAEESGVAHLLEHMAFKGTATRSARALVEEIESVGGYMNAATSYQRTGYYARVLSGDTRLAVDLLSDILLRPLCDAGDVEKEIEVVIQEIGEAWDAPDDAVFDLLQGACYRDQAAGRPILGSPASVRSHRRERLLDFMARFYRPENMIFAAAGGFDPEETARLAEDLFVFAGPGLSRPERAPVVYAGGAAHDRRRNEQTHLAAAFPGVGVTHDDFYATRILAEALGGGMSSRLFQSVREEHGLAYSVYAYADCFDDAGLVGIYAGTDPERAVEMTKLIRREIEAAAETLTQAEINRARAGLRSNLLMGLESPYGRIEMAAGQFLTYGAILTPDLIREKLDAVSLADVKRCARRMTEDGGASLATVGPADSGPIEEILLGVCKDR